MYIYVLHLETTLFSCIHPHCHYHCLCAEGLLGAKKNLLPHAQSNAGNAAMHFPNAQGKGLSNLVWLLCQLCKAHRRHTQPKKTLLQAKPSYPHHSWKANHLPARPFKTPPPSSAASTPLMEAPLLLKDVQHMCISSLHTSQ